MSNREQILSAAIGATVGFFVAGGPAGALAGLQYGLLAGALLFPADLPAVTGPRLEDFERLEADPGSPIWKVYGRISVPGFRMYLGDVTEISSTEEVGGKGAPSQDVTSYAYYQTLALGLCEGEIAGVDRIWENGELVYDSRPQLAGETTSEYQTRIVAANTYEDSFTLYTGTETQTADPTLETELGAGNVPGFRGLAYIVFADRLLREDQGQRHPTFKIEVNAISTSALVMVGDEKAAYSTDGGETWFNATTPPEDASFAEGDMRTVCHDTTRNRFVALGGGNSVWYSDDNGDNWTEVSSAVSSGTSNGFLHSLYHAASDTIWAARGGSGSGSGTAKVWYSEDGGLTWTGLDFQTAHTLLEAHWAAGLLFIEETNQLVVNFDGSGGSPTVFEVAIANAKTIGSWTKHTISSGLSDRWDQGDGHPRGLAYQSNSQRLIAGLAETSSFQQGSVAYSAVSDFSAWGQVDTGTQNNSDCVSVSYIPASNRLVAAFTFSATNPHIAWTTTPTSGWSTVSTATQPARGWNNGHYFAGYQKVFLCGNGYITSSPDGASWTEVAHAGDWRDIAVGSGLETVSIASILTDLCSRAGVDTIDAADLLNVSVRGYALTRETNARKSIETLRIVGKFDIVESGETLRFPARGAAEVVTLVANDLGARIGPIVRHEPSVTTVKGQDFELPRQIRLRYVSYSRDYEKGEQLSPARIGTIGVNDVTVDVPIVLDDDTARQVAETSQRDAWAARWTHEWSLDCSFAYLEPADVVLLPIDGALYRTRIVAIRDGDLLMRQMTGVRDDDGNYSTIAITVPPVKPTTPLAPLSATSSILLDLPALVDNDNNAGVYISNRRTSEGYRWSGAQVHRSIDSGDTYSSILAITAEGIHGIVVTPPTGQYSTWNSEAELIIDVYNGAALSSRSNEALLNSANAFAIGDHGRWHIVQFGTQEVIASGSPAYTRYRLTNLLLGRRGTEHLINTVQAGDVAVLVSSNIYRVGLQNSDIGSARLYRSVSVGATFDSAADQSFTGAGQSLECFSPVRVRGTPLVGSPGGLEISWIRRDRLAETLQDGVAVPNNEASESYEVDIIDRSTSPWTVVRTLASSTPSVNYTLTQMQADWGSPIPSTFRVRVYQLSAVVGRGAPAEAII